MSPLDGLTKEQQMYLVELAHQKFPAKFLYQRPVAPTLPEEEEDSDSDLYQLSANEDDDEGSQLYLSYEESERGDEYDEEIQVCSL